MSMDPASDLSVFLAYSLELERESAERLREGAVIMRAHGQRSAAALLEQLSIYSDRHAEEIAEICEAHALPTLKPWDFVWPDAEPPETCDYASMRYSMSDKEVLESMLGLEERTAHFYRSVGCRSEKSDVQQYAEQFAEEELSHAQALRSMIAALSTGVHPAPDIDPPREID